MAWLSHSCLARRPDRSTHRSLIAADEAIAGAGLDFEDSAYSQNAAVVLGTAVGGITTLLHGSDVLRDRGERRVSPLMIPMMMSNAAAGESAIRFGLHGLTLAVASACATGNYAIGEASRLIRTGAAPVVICGGSDGGCIPWPWQPLTKCRPSHIATRNSSGPASPAQTQAWHLCALGRLGLQPIQSDSCDPLFSSHRTC
jgi:hypothetical protein